MIAIAIAGGMTAYVTEKRGGLYIYDIVDGSGNTVARSRYVSVSAAPFSLTAQQEADFLELTEAPIKPVADARGEKWEEIKSERTAIELGGVQVGGKWYHTDDSSRIKYLGLYKLAEQALASGAVGTTVLQYGGQNIRWKTMDKTFVDMTVQRAQDVYFAVFGLDMTAFAAAEAHRVAMEASADPTIYDYSAGWPGTFPG